MEFRATENGDLAFTTCGDKNLDFFTRIVRDAPVNDYVPAFCDAWKENKEMATQILMNMRDIRKGKGEKLIPIVIIVCLKQKLPKDAYRNLLEKIIEYGYWKDLLKIMEMYTRLMIEINGKKAIIDCSAEISLFAEQLKKDYDILKSEQKLNHEGKNVAISLCGKWAPSEKTHYNKHPMKFADSIANEMKMTSKEYRKMLSELRAHLNILEMLMATQQYDKIDFSKIPSIAMSKHKNAFNRNTNADGKIFDSRVKLCSSYQEYLKQLSEGKTKVNVTGIQPHELVGQYFSKYDVDPLVESQWEAIKKRVMESGAFEKVTAIVDVSGSMNGLPMEVSIALGILVAECSNGPFKGQVITFSDNPSWHVLKGNNLMEKVHSMKKAEWGGSTDLRKVFDLILTEATRYNLKQEQMPETLFIFTDMQFNEACGRTDNWTSTFMDAKSSFEKCGYKLPKIVCWNLRTSTAKTLPCSKDEEGFTMLSGFSAELLKCIMDAQEFTPIAMLRHVLEPYIVPQVIIDCGIDELEFNNIGSLETAIKKSEFKKAFIAKSENKTDSS